MPPTLIEGRNGSGSTVLSCCARLCGGTCCVWPAKTTQSPGPNPRSTKGRGHSRRSPIGGPPRIGRIGLVQRGEVWFAATPGGDRPVLVLTRDPVADRIGAVVVAAVTRTRRGLVSELDLTVSQDGVPSDCVVNFDNLHTISRDSFRRRVVSLSPRRMAQACAALAAATGC